MPWCPTCKTEYRQGYNACADCGCPLVEDFYGGMEVARPDALAEKEKRLGGQSLPDMVRNRKLSNQDALDCHRIFTRRAAEQLAKALRDVALILAGLVVLGVPVLLESTDSQAGWIVWLQAVPDFVYLLPMLGIFAGIMILMVRLFFHGALAVSNRGVVRLIQKHYPHLPYKQLPKSPE